MVKQRLQRQKKRRHADKASAAPITPGALAPLAPIDPLYAPHTITAMAYGETMVQELTLSHVSDVKALMDKQSVLWLDVDGLGNPALIIGLCEMFGIHRLALEDIFDVNHQPKIEKYENYIFMVLKHGIYDESFETEQISLILMPGVVITIQERPGDSFNAVRERIRLGAGRIRQHGADFLACALLDAVVEGYYPILHRIRRKLDAIEEKVIRATGSRLIHLIHNLKNDLLFLHSVVWPIYDIVLLLSQHQTAMISKETAHYLRDCQDQAKQVKGLAEFYRSIASDLMSTYLALSDYRANEIMRVLTMVTAIFIPLSFIASVYGMNFNTEISPYNMPELHHRYGYPAVLMFMGFIALMTLYMFRRRGWLTSARRRDEDDSDGK